MGFKVGIPRALGYYYMFPFYKTFLDALGAEIVVSPPTTKATLDRMDACPTDEPCVAVKLYFAHTEKLLQMGVDFIWSPVLVSLSKQSYCCPKFLGISDMVRNGLYIDESRMLTPRFDRHLNDDEARRSFYEIASRLGVNDKGRVLRAIRKASKVQEAVERVMVSCGLAMPQAFEKVEEIESVSADRGHAMLDAMLDPLPRIGLIGHPYLIYDMLSHNLLDRLGEFGRVVTAEMVSREDTDAAMDSIFEGSRMWFFEGRMLGGALHLLRNHLIERIVLVGSFECGPESIIESYIEDEALRQGIPFLLLTLDEQTGEAGLVTRVEAFMDTSSEGSTPRVIPSESKLHGRKGGSLWTPDTAEPPASEIIRIESPQKTMFSLVEQISRSSERNDMVIGCPSMGFMDIAIRSILEDCGTACLPTPRTNKKTIELGTEMTPEFVCYPLAAILGQMRVLLDNGANTILMVNGKGRCRIGWYGQVQENLLRRAGYDFEMISLDSPFPLKTHWGAFRDSMKRLTGGASWAKILRAFWYGYQKMLALDNADVIVHKYRAIERERGSVDKIFSRLVKRMESVSDLGSVRREFRNFEEACREIETEDTHPLKVRVVGEIWVVLEQFANQQIEKMLAGQDRIRVEVQRELSATQWFSQNILSDPGVQARYKQTCRAASGYLSEEVGGHGMETIGATILAKDEGCDGVVHVFPFTCMPEIVAQNILVRVSEDLDIPMLTYIVSEQTGEAGLQTRIEAFLDILEERRRTSGVRRSLHYAA
ncbi:MAG TPA: acyl-CoA dehydratase activase-related protein [Armatimonadota bacterium]